MTTYTITHEAPFWFVDGLALGTSVQFNNLSDAELFVEYLKRRDAEEGILLDLDDAVFGDYE